MKKVLIVCGAGASSTFLALRVRRLLRERHIDLVVEAGTVPDLDERLPVTDLLLVGPHLADTYPALQQRADDAGTRAAILPDSVFEQEGAESAVDIVMEMLEPKETHHG